MKYAKAGLSPKITRVALYTSAWIEIDGLEWIEMQSRVALYTSAWIEIKVAKNVIIPTFCRTLHECVD